MNMPLYYNRTLSNKFWLSYFAKVAFWFHGILKNAVFCIPGSQIRKKKYGCCF